MKKQYLLFLAIIYSFSSYGQILFEQGYYINNSNEKIDCFIKNNDWEKNPTEFKFKLLSDGEVKTGSITSIKEFGINNFSKYIRRKVEIDHSSNDMDKLSLIKAPEFIEETLFLKVLIEGSANLYLYENKKVTRYFYNKENAPIEQLVYKFYEIAEQKIGENQKYKSQLWHTLKCPTLKVEKIQNLKYFKKELIDFFMAYHQCTNTAYVNYEKIQKRNLFNLNLRLGINNSSLATRSIALSSKDTDFRNRLSVRLGVEAEFILPFNKNKWTVIVEPTYRYFISKEELTNQIVEIDYKSIEVPIGIRHYFFFNQKSKIFVNGSIILDIINNAKIDYEFGDDLEIEPISNWALGVGYKQNDKYSIELRYQTPREILRGYPGWTSSFQTFSIIFGYSIL